VDSAWISADYRDLVDDRDWLAQNGPFDVAVLSKVLDCFSVFSIEPVGFDGVDRSGTGKSFTPSSCLSPRTRSSGLLNLAVKTGRQPCDGGSFMPQWSLSEYFVAMQAIMSSELRSALDNASYLPIRRFNPASLITKAGSSVIGEVLRVTRSLVIDDHDLTVADLQFHQKAFGLPNTAAVRVVDNARKSGSNQYIVTTREIANKLKGQRLW
jgi:hypothetical protein